MQSKGNAGIPLTTSIPFSYKKDPNGSKFWVVDEPAVEVVKHIFALCMDGKGPPQIAKILEAGKDTLTRRVLKKRRSLSTAPHTYFFMSAGRFARFLLL